MLSEGTTELLAVVFACEKFEPMILYSKSEVQTDHSALRQIYYSQEINGKIRRWLMKLAHLWLYFTFRRGCFNKLADAMSRSPDPTIDPGDGILIESDVALPLYEEQDGRLEFDERPTGGKIHQCGRCVGRADESQKTEGAENGGAEEITQSTLGTQTNDFPAVQGDFVQPWRRRKKFDRWPRKRFISKNTFPSKTDRTKSRDFYSVLSCKSQSDKKFFSVLAGQITDLDNLPQEPAQWAVEQGKDNELAHIKQRVEAQEIHGYVLSAEGVLQFENADGQLQIVVPQQLLKVALKLCHDSLLAGHYGIKKTQQRLSLYFKWNGMSKDAENWVKSCETCMRIKPRNSRKKGYFTATPEKCVGHEISVDLFGPLPRSKSGYTYCLIVSDTFSRWVECFPLKTANGKTVLDKTFEYCLRNGFPLRIRSDRGTTFCNQLWELVLTKLGIKQKFSAPWRPQGNPVERQIKEVKTRIKSYVERHDEWDKHLENYVSQLEERSIKRPATPRMFYIWGEKCETPFVRAPDRPVEDSTDYSQTAARHLNDLLAIYRQAAENILISKGAMARQYNQGRKGHEFEVGQLVLKDEHRLSDAVKKFAAGLAPLRSTKVFRIEAQRGPNSFILKDTQSNYRCVANADQISLFYARPPYLE